MELRFYQLNLAKPCLTYLVGTKKGSSRVILVDPVLKHLNSYLEFLRQENLKLTYVIDTHTHADHISAGSALKDQTKCEYAMHREIHSPPLSVTLGLSEGFEYRFGSVSFKVLLTRGHTKDSISLLFPDRILTGDALFLDNGGAGRDDLPGGDPGEHWETLQRFRELPDHLVVYPAHDYRNRQPSTLGEQKTKNPHLKPRTKAEYIQYLESLRLGPAEWMKEVLKANQACSRNPNAVRIPDNVSACEIMGSLPHTMGNRRKTNIPVEELRGQIQNGHPPLLLDVREAGELESELGHLPGIVHIPLAELPEHLNELGPDKKKEIVTVCRSGSRAQTAAKILMEAGFKKVSVLTGGMIAWQTALDN